MSENTNGNSGADKDRDLKPGETRDTKVETHTPGEPEEKEVERKHEEGPKPDPNKE